MPVPFHVNHLDLIGAERVREQIDHSGQLGKLLTIFSFDFFEVLVGGCVSWFFIIGFIVQNVTNF